MPVYGQIHFRVLFLKVIDVIETLHIGFSLIIQKLWFAWKDFWLSFTQVYHPQM
jgi:hypothetical protein